MAGDQFVRRIPDTTKNIQDALEALDKREDFYPRIFERLYDTDRPPHSDSEQISIVYTNADNLYNVHLSLSSGDEVISADFLDRLRKPMAVKVENADRSRRWVGQFDSIGEVIGEAYVLVVEFSEERTGAFLSAGEIVRISFGYPIYGVSEADEVPVDQDDYAGVLGDLDEENVEGALKKVDVLADYDQENHFFGVTPGDLGNGKVGYADSGVVGLHTAGGAQIDHSLLKSVFS